MTHQQQRWHQNIPWAFVLGVTAVLAVVTGIAIYICLFKLIDNDFFWHVKSGELMWKAGALLREEPYSYVLQGKPYGALHEWLAQIIFYLVYNTWGVVGSILLRGIVTAAVALIILSFDLGSMWLMAPIVTLSLYDHRASLMVRPQLFTILLLALLMTTILRYLRRGEHHEITRSIRRSFALTILFIQLLWVNLHGASAIYGVLAIGALWLQGWHEKYVGGSDERRFRSILLIAAAITMLGSPNLFKTFFDMYAHRFDGTIPLVREWMPLIWRDYATDVLPFGVFAAILMMLRRRAWVFSGVMLIATGFLSLQAYRHCILFVVIALSISAFQLSAYPPWIRVQERLKRMPIIAAAGTIALLLLLLFGMYQRDLKTVFRNNDFGFGIGIPVIGAVHFVAAHNIDGTLFNTYNQGGYILYRLSPQRKVFADGRNIEYGYPFVQKILDAGANSARWKELEQQYGFTYAIVEYKAMPEYGMYRPYIENFEADPSWKLIYLDDIATVYVRDLPLYADIIRQFSYRILTPNALEFTDVIDRLPASQWPAVERELRRVISESQDSIRARIILSNHLMEAGKLAEAKVIILEALTMRPYMSELYEILGRIAVANQDWSEAGEALEKSAELVAKGGPGINYDYLAMIFSRAGQNDKAEIYHRKAIRAGQQSSIIGTP
jgi:hypothetical protein